MNRRWMLLDSKNNVVGELVSPGIIAEIQTGKYSLLRWKGRRYVYSSQHRNGEYEFFCEVGLQINVPPKAVLRKDS